MRLKEYVASPQVIKELKSWLKAHADEKVDYITFSGSGEPLLHSEIGYLIGQVKKITNIPVAVITNSFLLTRQKVRKQILQADLIIPSLDAVSQDIFRRVDCPLPGIKVKDIIKSLICLRKEYKGKIWLEVMLIAGINDSREHVVSLKKAILRINPDKIQLNSPVRVTAQPGINAPSANRLKEIKEFLGDNCQII
jgi:wyosine [tRNA(Phe)-imidazoG37] synthetase (radical SAM superfamily)